MAATSYQTCSLSSPPSGGVTPETLPAFRAYSRHDLDRLAVFHRHESRRADQIGLFQAHRAQGLVVIDQNAAAFERLGPDFAGTTVVSGSGQARPSAPA